MRNLAKEKREDILSLNITKDFVSNNKTNCFLEFLKYSKKIKIKLCRIYNQNFLHWWQFMILNYLVRIIAEKKEYENSYEEKKNTEKITKFGTNSWTNRAKNYLNIWYIHILLWMHASVKEEVRKKRESVSVRQCTRECVHVSPWEGACLWANIRGSGWASMQGELCRCVLCEYMKFKECYMSECVQVPVNMRECCKREIAIICLHDLFQVWIL